MCDYFSDWPWRHWARHIPDAIVLQTGERNLSWLQLATYIDDQANSWHRAGVQPSCGVGLIGKNSPVLLIAYLAALQCGARVLPLNPRLPAALLTRLLPTLNLDFGWGDDDLFGSLGIIPLIANRYAQPVLDSDPPYTPGTQVLPTETPLKTARGHTPNDFPFLPPATVPWDAGLLATLTLTSGSSGLPKAAAHRYIAHLCNAAGVIALLDFHRDCNWLLSLPLFHISGQGIVWRWLSAGARLTIRGDIALESAMTGCTHVSLVPTQLLRLLDGNIDGLNLRAVLLGGAMIPPDLTERAEAQGICCWCSYGLTEFASTVCAKRADGRPGVGLPLPGSNMRLVAEEVWLRGSCQAAGYWQQGALVPLDQGDGWFHTRDRGILQKGELCIVGRLDNLFFCGGEGVQPEDIERLLASHAGVRQSFVVPVDNREFGQQPVVVVDGEVPLAELRAWLAPQLAPWQRPVSWYYLPAALKQGGIKIARSTISAWLMQREANIVIGLARSPRSDSTI